MQSDYRVKKLVTEEGGDVVAICYDVLYGETFEKYIGIPDDFDARENASNLLQDSNYEISDEIRAEIEETFGLTEFDDDQDYDGYQFYDFGDDEWEEDEDEIDELVYAGNANGISTEDEEEEFTIPTRLLKRESFNLREALNTIDLNTYNKYDLLNLYEACNLSENEKRALANIVYDQNDPSVIYDTLNNRFLGKEIEMPERVKDGVIHENADGYEVYGSWSVDFDITFEGEETSFDNLSETIQEHITESIKDGYVQGKIVEDYGTGWWVAKIECYLDNKGDVLFDSLDESSQEHIAESIKEGYTSGELCVWVDGDIDESKSIKEDVDAKTFSQWFDETRKGAYKKEYEADYYPFANYIKTFPNAEVLKDATAEDIKNNAHKFYDIYNVDSVDREAAFTFASEELGVDYDDFYYAWMNDRPIKGVNESVDKFEFDDEFNAYYDGYTSELTDNEKKLLILAQDMGNWGDLIVDDEENHKEYDRVESKAKKICKEKGITFSELLDTIEDEGFNEDLETSTEWEHTDKDGRKVRIRQYDDKGNRKPLTRKQAKEIADFRGYENDDLNPVLSESNKKK